MLSVVLSALIFGLIHPLSKVLIDSGVPLSYFCISYVGIRLIIQFPIFIIRKEFTINIKKHLFLLIFFGVIGASLQFFEFKAIDAGLKPGTVTFLMFTYPVWISVFKIFNGDKDYILPLKVIAATFGMFLVSNATIEEIKNTAIFYPLLAGLSIALWILISNKLRKSGLGIIKISTYYDFFSLIFLIIKFNDLLILDFSHFNQWLTISNGLYLIAYSLAVGLLPNLLFYYGSKSVDSITSGMVIAFEPILSTAYSFMLWGSALTDNFLLGAILIFMANMPSQIFKNLKIGMILDKKRHRQFETLIIKGNNSVKKVFKKVEGK